MTHILLWLLDVVDLQYILFKLNFDFYDNHDGDEFIQYKKGKHENKMLV